MSEPLPTLSTFNCFACGPDNPVGLHLQFSEAGPGRVRTEFEIDHDRTGIGRVVHGGILVTVLDEAMAWCLYRYRYASHVTATMEQRFPGTVRSGVPLVAEAWIAEDRGSRLRLEARMWEAGDPDRTLVEGQGLYVRTPDATMEELPEEQREELKAVFAEYRERDGR